MKKVLFTATVDSHILQFHLPFLKLFKEKGYEVHVATNGNEEIPYCDVKHIVSFERSPFNINNFKAIFQLRKIINKEKFDIIHTHTPMGSVVTRLASISSRKKNHTRVIYTAHGLHFYKGAPIKNWLMFYPVEKILSKYTDTLILINKEDYDLCKKKFKKCKDIEYVPGVGIDENKFNFKMTQKEKIDLRKSLGLKKDDFVMIYPAELSKRKRQIWLINTISNLLKEHNDMHLLLPGKDSLSNKCQNLVKELKLDNQIHFLGYRNDIPKLLNISNLAISSSNQEGLPVNIMEAMYVGLPIVASNCRGNRDLIEDNKNGYLVELEDKDRFINSIEKIYNSKDVSSFSKESKQIIKDYLLDKVMIDMNEIYFRKKRVLHVLASKIYSGAENVACMIINNLSSEFDMAYCSPKGSIEEALKEKNIEYIPLKKLSIIEIRTAIKQFNPDVIHAHDNKATVLCSLFAKKYNVISHIHGNNKIMNSLNLKTILFNFATKNISSLIWVSDSSLDNYYFKNKIKNKSIVLYNIVDSKTILKKSKEYVCNQYFDLIFLGRLGYPKNPERLIDIIKLVKENKIDISVAIVGDGPDRINVEKLIQKYNLSSNIKLYGFQSNPFPILNNSKILIMTSIYEGTPMCALEAQSLGKPIISTPVDGLKYIILNGVNGYLLDDEKKFANTILEILKSNKIYTKLSDKSVELFNDYNNLSAYINTISSIYLSNIYI